MRRQAALKLICMLLIDSWRSQAWCIALAEARSVLHFELHRTHQLAPPSLDPVHCVSPPACALQKPMKRPPISEQQLSFCRGLKKVELHAHLNGSVRDSTLRYLQAS